MFGLLWREHQTEITLPALTGHFYQPWGGRLYTWINNGSDRRIGALLQERSGGSGMDVGTRRRLRQTPHSGEYLPAPWRRKELSAEDSGLSSDGAYFFSRDLALVRTHSTSRPDVSPEQRSYPVVIHARHGRRLFDHGLHDARWGSGGARLHRCGLRRAFTEPSSSSFHRGQPRGPETSHKRPRRICQPIRRIA